ncbi:1081_t:CDS:10, partial [Entrophospora sp. SA101]
MNSKNFKNIDNNNEAVVSEDAGGTDVMDYNNVGHVDDNNYNDDRINLTQVLKSLTTTWSDTTFVKHASNSLQLYVTSAILIIFGYLPKEILLKINIYKDIGVGTTQWMKSSFDRTRKIAMITVEMLSWLLDENDDVLDFKLDPQDEEVKTLRQLVDAKDGLNNLLIINTEEEDDDDNENRSFKRNKDINDENNSQSISVITNSFEEDFDQSSNVIDEDETTKLVGDSDDEDDFEPYSMDESDFDENEEDYDTLATKPKNTLPPVDFDENEEDYDTLATKPKNTLPPVYIIDLFKMLKAAEDPEKIEIAMNTAEKLIRLKTNFGTELDENANELARVLISINNTFELKEFEEKRHAALTALVVGSPKNTLDPQDEEVKTLRQLVDAKDGLNNLLIINTEEEDDDDNENRSFKRNKDINDENNSQSISVITNSFEEDFDQSSNVIDEDETTKLVGDSDDEDDFEPYSMDESDFDENEEDYDTLATKPKNTLPPVYIIDLIKMLKAAEDPEKIEIAMNTAEKLIRLKTNFGTEL